MSKAHARQGSPALSHGLAPARGVGGCSRTWLTSTLSDVTVRAWRSMLAFRSVQQSDHCAR
jgi:hypothetical protein